MAAVAVSIHVDDLMSKFSFFVCSFLIFSSFTQSDDFSKKCVQRIHAHLLIHDTVSAIQEASDSLTLYPDSAEIWRAYICALSKSDDEKEMMAAWKKYAAKFPDAYDDREPIEAMAWGVIEKGERTSNPLIRLYAIIGAFFSQDAKGIDILSRHIADNNTCIRGAAIKLASELHDAKLCDAVQLAFRKERNPKVRAEVIKAIGNMKIKSAKDDLFTIVADSKSSAEEKAAAIQAIVGLLDTANRDEVRALAFNDRAGLRVIACKIVLLFDLLNEIDLVYPLLKDPCSEVRSAAIGTLGSLGIEQYRGRFVSDIAFEMLSDTDPDVSIMAAWALTLKDPQRGQQAFKKWLNHDQQSLRIYAAGALNACGKYGMPLAEIVYKQSTDPYVKLNLAIGLIGQRACLEEACSTLCQGLMNNEDRWAWHERGQFKLLTPSKIVPDSMSLESPVAVNQHTRLEIINILAILNYKKVEEALVSCLLQRQWGVSGMAAALLLTEGDDAALDLVRNLLNTEQHSIRIQAALILAMWGRDEQALSILKNAYPTADRELKEFILESFGRVGDKASIPFLVERLQEPSQSLRIIAATALLQTLYH